MSKRINCVLLVDDDEATNFLNKITITTCNCVSHVHSVDTGRKALAFLMSVTTATTEALTCVPDLVLLDINLPGMDGWEFLEIVSKNSALKSKIKIAILSNLPKEDYIEKAESFDCVFNYIEKPLTESHLIEMANQFL